MHKNNITAALKYFEMLYSGMSIPKVNSKFVERKLDGSICEFSTTSLLNFESSNEIALKPIADKHGWFTIDSVQINQSVELVASTYNSMRKIIIPQVIVRGKNADGWVELDTGQTVSASHWKPSEILLPE